MSKTRKTVSLCCSLLMGSIFIVSPLTANEKNADKKDFGNREKTKNIIFMIPDGQGLSNVTAARIFKNGLDGDPLYQETLQHIGYQRTHSLDATVTDSAAAASAWATGVKYKNNEVSCHGVLATGECTDEQPTILELAAAKGKATGLVATSEISHATPAAFAAHTTSRYCGAEIARQYIEDTKVDVILGGGILGTSSGKGCDAYTNSWAQRNNSDYIPGLAAEKGYEYVTSKTGMEAAVEGRSRKVLGMFTGDGSTSKTIEYFRVDGSVYPEQEPTLPEMTSAALSVLEKDKDGLFLMVEGSQIDWGNHANDMEYQIAESLAFDEAVKVVLDWVNANPERKNNTLVIIVADHDSGGFGINGPTKGLSEAGDLDSLSDGWTSADHTAVDTIIYSQGPGSEKLNAARDNTDLYYVMESALH